MVNKEAIYVNIPVCPGVVSGRPSSSVSPSFFPVAENVAPPGPLDLKAVMLPYAPCSSVHHFDVSISHSQPYTKIYKDLRERNHIYVAMKSFSVIHLWWYGCISVWGFKSLRKHRIEVRDAGPDSPTNQRTIQVWLRIFKKPLSLATFHNSVNTHLKLLLTNSIKTLLTKQHFKGSFSRA